MPPAGRGLRPEAGQPEVVIRPRDSRQKRARGRRAQLRRAFPRKRFVKPCTSRFPRKPGLPGAQAGGGGSLGEGVPTRSRRTAGPFRLLDAVRRVGALAPRKTTSHDRSRPGSQMSHPHVLELSAASGRGISHFGCHPARPVQMDLPSRIVPPVANPLQVIADMPTVRPGLGFPQYVEALADAVRGGEPPQFTIGLYGSWGSGKSSLLAALNESLSHRDSGVIPVLFDAWRYERSDFIVVPLLHAVYTRSLELGNRTLARTLQRVLQSLLFSVNFSLHSISISPKAAKESWDESGLTGLDSAFSQPFAELRKVPSVLQGKRIAVLIDDLDRCSADHVVELLEAINLTMDIPGFIFVLALDYEVIVRAVQQRYPHASGHAFIEKIVQLPFRVPPLELSLNNFADLVPDWENWKSRLPPAFAASSVDISTMALRGNPRQIKRFLNSFLFIQRIIEKRGLRVDYELLAAVIGLQLAWPDYYRRVQDSLIIGESDPSTVLLQAEELEGDPWLSRYSSRFFSGKDIADQLRILLQLTAVVVGNQLGTSGMLPPLPAPANVLRERHRVQVINRLEELGYTQDNEIRDAWCSTEHPDWRFMIRKHKVSLQVWLGRRWQYWRGYLLTREMEQFMHDARMPHMVVRERDIT